MSSGDSYQCSSMQDHDDELDGLSPTSMWRRMKRRDPFEDEDEDEEDEQEEEEEDDEEKEDEEEEEEIKPVTNAEEKGKLPVPIIPVAAARVVPPPQKMKHTTRIGLVRESLNTLYLPRILLSIFAAGKLRRFQLRIFQECGIITSPKGREDRHRSGSLAGRWSERDFGKTWQEALCNFIKLSSS
ncbi:hypothetical protein QYE76_029112 [Lolium multiflorum]|uniref:Uncharacterized protein n=1 Tax=Lolium multiflorum TaxID=4521 RepID=A0AAD8QNY4_LOLMU|nr:hypothetical protein QYE76_029112 [Lolium multiflorum]